MFWDILSYNTTLGHNSQVLEYQLYHCESLRSQEKNHVYFQVYIILNLQFIQ